MMDKSELLSITAEELAALSEMEQARMLVAMKSLHDDIKATEKNIKAHIDLLSKCVMEYLMENELQSVKIDGRNLSLKQTVYTVKRGPKEQVARQLQQDPEFCELITLGFNDNSLNSKVKAILKEHEIPTLTSEEFDALNQQKMILPACLSIGVKHDLSITKG